MERFVEGQLIMHVDARWIGDGCHPTYLVRESKNGVFAKAVTVDPVTQKTPASGSGWNLTNPSSWRVVSVLEIMAYALAKEK